MTGRASVIVPTYRRPDQIACCVAALQAQEGCEIEIVVVDDGSPEPPSGLTEGPHPLRVLRQANAGPAAARNAGAAQARHPLLLFTDDDCRPAPGWAAAFLRAAASGARPTLMGGRTVNALSANVYAQASQDMNDYLTDRADPGEPFFASNNVAVPAAQFHEIGGFDTGYRRAAGEDRAFCRSWQASGHPSRYVPEAALEHHHDLGFGSFWRQHRNYGFGAARFHGAEGAGAFRPFSRLGFYGGLVAGPLRSGPVHTRLTRAGLVAAAQLATIQGYRDARRTGPGETRRMG